MFCNRLGVSERRACWVVGQHRSTQRYEPTSAEDDAALRQQLREISAQRLRAERPNHVWALDFQHDQTADGSVLRLLNVVYEFTREALEMLVERSIDADATVSVLERLVSERGAPARRSARVGRPWRSIGVIGCERSVTAARDGRDCVSRGAGRSPGHSIHRPGRSMHNVTLIQLTGGSQ